MRLAKINEFVLLEKKCYRIKLFCVALSVILCVAVFTYQFIYKGVDYASPYSSYDKFHNNDVHYGSVKNMSVIQGQMQKSIYNMKQYCDSLHNNENEYVDSLMTVIHDYENMYENICVNEKSLKTAKRT